MKIAGIDIGTNTVLMMLAEKNADSHIKIIRDEISLARLGENLYSTNKISSSAIERASEILNSYRRICDEESVEKILISATSAMRQAENSADVKKVFENIIKSEINIIGGEEEARLSFLGSVENVEDACLIDIGGGSTEFISGAINQSISKQDSINCKLDFVKSIDIGAVRITENFFFNLPPNKSEISSARDFIRRELKNYLDNDLITGELFAVAGTPVTIASAYLQLTEYDKDKLQGFVLSQEMIENILDSFLKKSSEEISQEYTIHPLRADVITAGALILSEALLFLKRDYCIVSTYGLRYGLIKDYFANNN